MNEIATQKEAMDGLVLSVFPGLDLFGREFEAAGYTVLRGPDLLWGGDARTFHPPPGIFAGVIGGPPCKFHSVTTHLPSVRHTKSEDLTSEFLRIVDEAEPKWAVMENVRGVLNKKLMPSTWSCVRLRDWDCGGRTFRIRYFWIWPSTLVLAPSKRPGKPEHSVLASSWKDHNGTKKFHGHSHITLEKAAELQGYSDLLPILEPLGRQFGIILLGNGVPRAMGSYVAKATKHFQGNETDSH